MILVGQYDSPYVRRVAASLHVLGLPFARNPISVFADADAMRRINPLGRVPSLILDDGEVVIDSSAILDHIDELVGPGRALIPPAGPERRRVLRQTALAMGATDKAIAIAIERLILPAEKQYAPLTERLHVQLASGLDALETVPQTPWLGGARLLQPDVTVACLIGYLRLRVPETFPAGRYPALERLAAAAEALPALQATQPADFETVAFAGAIA